MYIPISSINSYKSKVMFISSRQNRQLVQSYPERPYHDSVINSCLSGKWLDGAVNNSISWSDHIETVIKKCNIYLYMLSRIKLYLSTDNRKRFHNAYILPHFGETAHITFFNSIQFKNFI